jgi:hypothetical protein
MINIDCKDNDQGVWCKNKNVKRSLFGLGARMCVLYPGFNDKECKYQTKMKRPIKPAPAPPPRPREKGIEINATFLVIQK